MSGCERCENHDPRDRRDHGHLPASLLADEPATLMAKYRLPVEPATVSKLARSLTEYGPVSVSVWGVWLEVHAHREGNES